MGAKDFFRPTGLKLGIAAGMALPCMLLIAVLSTVLGVYVPSFYLTMIIFGLVFGYLISCGLDALIKNTAVKIAIASVSALISIWLGYIIIRSMTMVCDPVHNPGICDPVHNPSPCEANCENIYNNAANITDALRTKYSDCIQGCFK